MGSLVALAVAEERPCAGLMLLSSPIYYSHAFFYLASCLAVFGLYHHWNGTGLDPKKAALVCYDKIPYKSVAELNSLQGYCRKNIAALTCPVTAYFGGKDPLVGVKKSEAFLKAHSPKADIHEFTDDGHGLLFAPDAEKLFLSISALFA